MLSVSSVYLRKADESVDNGEVLFMPELTTTWQSDFERLENIMKKSGEKIRPVVQSIFNFMDVENKCKLDLVCLDYQARTCVGLTGIVSSWGI